MQKEIFVFIQLLHDYWIKKNKRNIIDKSYAKNSAPLHDKIVFRLTNVNTNDEYSKMIESENWI